MNTTQKKLKRKRAFTIVELLTVMSIIIILIGLLVPGLNKAKIFSKKVKQSAQFHSIGVALDLYSAENDGYPDSGALPNPAASGAAPYTTGSHRLAEALVGRDLQGYDPCSSWDAKADETLNIYGRGTAPTVEASIERRKGPYLDNADTFQLCQLYSSTGNAYAGQADPASGNKPYSAPVLTDVYQVKSVTLSTGKTVKAGTPILYYKANSSSRIFDWSDTDVPLSIYNSIDNEALVALGKLNTGEEHHFDVNYKDASNRPGRQIFYNAITNPQIPVVPTATYQGCPYNKESYILISAGYDGIFGTNDDIVNFSNQ